MNESVRGNKVFPAITTGITVLFLLVTYFMLVAIVPTFKAVFNSFGAKLPLLTITMIWTSEISKRFFYLIIPISITLLIFFFRFCVSKPKQSQIRILIYTAVFWLLTTFLIVYSMFLPMSGMGEAIG